MKDEARAREDALTQSSEAIMHESPRLSGASGGKALRGYMPHPAEREERGEPRELFSMQNSYSGLSVGADKKGDMMITGAAERRHDSPTLENDAKRVEGARRKKHPIGDGEFFTNPAKPEESAFAYRVNRRMPERKILRRIRESARRHDLEEFGGTLPFLDLHENEEELRQKRREDAPVSETQRLERIIRDKKALEMRFLRQLRLARKKMSGADVEELLAQLFGKEEEPTPQPLPAAGDASSEEEGEGEEAPEEE